jgi:hypothetical protein
MPLDKLVDFTTKGTKPVICQQCHASFESSSSSCTTGKEMGLANIYVQDAISTMSEKLRLSNNIPWVSDHTYLPSQLSTYASDCRKQVQPSADYSGTSDYQFGYQYSKGSCSGSETGYGFKLPAITFVRHQPELKISMFGRSKPPTTS